MEKMLKFVERLFDPDARDYWLWISAVTVLGFFTGVIILTIRVIIEDREDRKANEKTQD
jgi:hypothetical protein